MERALLLNTLQLNLGVGGQRTTRKGESMIRSMALVACAACMACASVRSGTTGATAEMAVSGADPSIVAAQAFRLLFERGIAHRDTVAINAAVAPELKFHERQTVARIPRAALLGMANEILTGFPDVHFTVPSVVAHGDTAAARVEFTGTHRGVWEGIPATGRSVHVTEMFFCHLRNGQLSECWEEWDKWGLIQQLRATTPSSRQP